MRGDKLLNYRVLTGKHTQGEINCIEGVYVLDELVHDLIKKHDEIVAKSNGQIKAVAFNFLYSVDCRIIDICNAYIDNNKEFENIFVANRMSTALFSNTTNVLSYYSGGRSNLKTYLNPKYFVISNLPEVVIILYSCCHPKDYETYMNVFKSNGIKIGYFNENPNVENTVSGCFDKKFYYSILIDDKAGFNPKDWSKVQSYFLKYRSKTKTLNVNNLVTKTVEWLALILSIVGYVGIADKAVWGFYVWIISNICLGYLAIKNRQSPLLLLYILYTIANIYTIYQWSN